MRVILGSGSDRKVATCRRAFERAFGRPVEVVGVETASGVPETPWGDETYRGARNRAEAARAAGPADFYLGLESGLIDRHGEVFEEAWAVLLAANGVVYSGYSSGLRVPDRILTRMAALGRPHCEVMALFQAELGMVKGDTWANYSGGLISREASLEEAVRNAVLQAVPHPDNLYRRSG
jgi:inosine/xanthosine triphosphatase